MLDPTIIKAFKQVLSEESFITDSSEIEYYSQDVYRSFEKALAILKPNSVNELCQTVSIAAEAKLSIVTRGGGMSYTDGYLHTSNRGITIDTQNLNNIIEINAEDMYVSVECGCTWQALNNALAEYGLRPPYWGPLSGMRATIGGALSQNSVFWGGTSYGSAAESVMGMDVILANGKLISTGSNARSHGLPFMRYDGPDLTGLFIGDTGAFGIKARATLRLLPIPAHTAHASFSFDTHEQVCAAMSDIARKRLATECYAFDPYYSNSKVMEGNTDLVEDIKTLGRVAEKSGVKESLKIAVAGRRFAKKVMWGLHLHLEADYQEMIEKNLEAINAIISSHKGWEIPNSIPKIVAACPFPPTNSMVGPSGQRWVPIHGKVAHSQAAETIEKINKWHADNAEIMREHKIDTAYLLCTMGTGAFLIEPVYLWPDELDQIHYRNVEETVMKGFKKHARNAETRKEVDRLRNGIRDIFLDQGAVHFQIGKYYPYRESRKAESWELIEEIKTLLDKNNIMNPGQLGFDYEN